MLHRACLIVVILVFSTSPTYAYADAIYTFLKDKQDEIALVKQYAEMIKITKEMNVELKKINQFSETISEHTNIKITSTEEAYRLLTDENYQKNQAVKSVLYQPYFKKNPEISNALKKVANNQDLSHQDLAGIVDILTLDKESDELIIRRLQRKGYSERQISSLMDIVREVRANQDKLVEHETEIHKYELKIAENTALHSEAREKYRTSGTAAEKNQARTEELALAQLIQGDKALLFNLKSDKNKLIIRQKKLLDQLRRNEIAFSYIAMEKEQLSEELEEIYRAKRSKGDAAEERMIEFTDYGRKFLVGE